MTQMTDPAPAAGVDGIVERLGRWTAGRTTRRSFLGRLGRVGVLVAGGTAMAGLLADQAEARVCGQSGVSPKCDTFTCDATWGWCWYASGCCADGALKKICDCCAPNTPNPVGYCPSGTRVLCIMESCGADPRLQTKPVHVMPTYDPTHLTVALSRSRFPDGAPIAVVGDADDAMFGALAASTAHLVEGPALLTPRAGLAVEILDELRRLRVEFVKVVGSSLSGIAEEVAGHGFDVEHLGPNGDLSESSADVALWSRPLSGRRTAVVLLPGGEHGIAPAAALANRLRSPLLIGEGPAIDRALNEPRPVRGTFVVSGDAADAGRYPGGRALVGTRRELSLQMASTAIAGAQGVPALLAVEGEDRSAVAMACVPGALLLHPAGSLGVFDWLLERRLQLDGAYVAGDRSTFPAEAEYDLQSVVNEYETHLLRGSAGEGLPVIPQPREERPIGKARR